MKSQLSLRSPRARSEDAAQLIFSPQRARSETMRLRGKILEYALVGGFVVALAAYEWLRQMIRLPQPLLGLTLFAAALAGYCGVRIALLIPRLRTLRRGRQAWRSLQIDIDQLTQRGFYLFERVQDEAGMELGPVLAGPSGIYPLSIRSNARRGGLFETVEQPDSQSLLIDGRPPLGDPLAQARAAAERLERLLASRNLPAAPVIPVLVYPGWKIGQRARGEPEVLLTSEKDLAAEILRRPSVLEPRELIPLCEGLSQLAAAAPRERR